MTFFGFSLEEMQQVEAAVHIRDRLRTGIDDDYNVSKKPTKLTNQSINHSISASLSQPQSFLLYYILVPFRNITSFVCCSTKFEFCEEKEKEGRTTTSTVDRRK